MSLLRGVASRLKLARSLGVAVCLLIATISLASATAGGTAVAAVQPHGGAPEIGNQACGHVGITPYTNLTGGEAIRVKVRWTGSSSNAGCTVNQAECPNWFTDCSAGYWVVGLWCSTLAATNLSTAQGDCDLNNIVVLSDYNAGPNNAPDNHGTSWNQCSTVSTLGSIFGGLPGTLNCIPEGGGQGWTEKWHLGKTTGYGYGPVEETGSSVGFNPGTSGVDCPPSAANIAAGALPGYCAFVVLPINFEYECAFDVCIPSSGGTSEDTTDYLATLLQYANAPT